MYVAGLRSIMSVTSKYSRSASGGTTPRSAPLQAVGRTTHPRPATIQHLPVNHRRPHIDMAQQLLNGANTGAFFQQMRRERVPKRMTYHTLSNPGYLLRGLPSGPIRWPIFPLAVYHGHRFPLTP